MSPEGTVGVGRHETPDADAWVDVFAEARTYTVSLCAVDKVSDFDKQLSAELLTVCSPKQWIRSPS